MPRRTLRPYGHNQTILLPPSLRERLRAHLDLTPIPTTHGGVTRGTVPSDPQRRVAVLFYAEARGVPASRQIARKLHEDIAFQPWRRIARRISRPSVTSARSIWTRSWTYSCRRSSRLRKNSVGTAERRWSARVAISAGCSKRPFSKAAASEEARRVDLVHLVCVVHLVGLVQPTKQTKQTKQQSSYAGGLFQHPASSVSGRAARCVQRGAGACTQSGHPPASRFSGRSSRGKGSGSSCRGGIAGLTVNGRCPVRRTTS